MVDAAMDRQTQMKHAPKSEIPRTSREQMLGERHKIPEGYGIYQKRVEFGCGAEKYEEEFQYR